MKFMMNRSSPGFAQRTPGEQTFYSNRSSPDFAKRTPGERTFYSSVS